jgi:GTPase SAR1 family protein
MNSQIESIVNLVILGNSNVGKSNLAMRFLKNEFYEF